MIRMRYKYSAMYDGPVFWHYHNLPPDCPEQQLADEGCVKVKVTRVESLAVLTTHDWACSLPYKNFH